jgi:hypothetical protein
MAFSMLLRLQIVENLQHSKGIGWDQESTLYYMNILAKEKAPFTEKENTKKKKTQIVSVRLCVWFESVYGRQRKSIKNPSEGKIRVNQ